MIAWAIQAEYFGLKADIDTPAVRAANDAAILDIQNHWSVSSAAAGTKPSIGPRILFGPGAFYFGAKAAIKRCVILMGAVGRFIYGSTTFVFPDDTGGVQLQAYRDTGRVSQATYGKIEDIRIVTRSSYPTVQVIKTRVSSTFYAQGAIMVPDYVPGAAGAEAWGYSYRNDAVGGGTTAATDPGTWKTANPETTVSGTAKTCTFTNGSANVAATAHGLSVGHRCRFDTSGTLPGNFAFDTDYFVKTVADANTITVSATSGGAAILASGVGSGSHNVQRTIVADMTAITDGSCTWTPILAHGLDVRGTGWAVDAIDVEGFPSNAVNINCQVGANAQQNMGNLFRATNCTLGNSGVCGIFTYGSDSNAHSFDGCDISYNRGYGVYDRPGARNTYNSCHFAYNENGVWSDSSAFNDCYSEGLSSPPWVLKASARWRGGSAPTSNHYNAANFTGHYHDGCAPPVAFSALPVSGVTVGTLTLPNTPNGQAYVVIASAGSGAKGAEPSTWPLGFCMLETFADLSRKDVVSGDLTFRPWGLAGGGNDSSSDYDISEGHNGSRKFEGLGNAYKPWFRAGSNASSQARAFTFGGGNFDSGVEWSMKIDTATGKYWELSDDSGKVPYRWTVSAHALGAGIPVVPHSEIWNGTSSATTTPEAGQVVRRWVTDRFVDRTATNTVTFPPLQDCDTAAPSSGTWPRGWIRWNSTPSAGGAPGWVCTTAGTPGTWKAMANLAA